MFSCTTCSCTSAVAQQPNITRQISYIDQVYEDFHFKQSSIKSGYTMSNFPNFICSYTQEGEKP